MTEAIHSSQLSGAEARRIAEDHLAENQVTAGPFLGMEHIPASKFNDKSGRKLTGGSWLVRFASTEPSMPNDSTQTGNQTSENPVTIVVNDVTGGAHLLLR